MPKRRIADLHAALTWDLADFDKGTSHIEAGFKTLRDKAMGLADSFRSIGRNLTTYLNVLIAGAAAGFGVMAKGLAEDAKAMENAARLAGAGFEEFQRKAYAAQDVGIGFEKLSDIFKDTQDKVGDFIASGGGEMADFFENIAPKVGVTADMFRRLSGPEALQLYYTSLEKAGVSQSDMVFYMEAIADEASGLAPLLAQNGRLMEELGAKAPIISAEQAASLARYREALKEMAAAMRRLTIAVVDSGLLNALVGIVEAVAGFIGRFAEANPGLFRFAAGALLVLAAVGPLLSVLTALATLVLPLVLVNMGPLFLALSALINPLGTAFVFLTKLVGGFGGLVSSTGLLASMLGRLGLVFLRFLGPIGLVISAIVLFKDEIVAALSAVWDKAREVLGPAFERLGERVGALVDRLTQMWHNFANSAFGQFVAMIVDRIGELIGAFVLLSGSSVVRAIEFLIELLSWIVQYVTDMVNVVDALLRGDFTGAWDAAQVAVTNAIGGMLPMFQALQGWIYDTLELLGLMERRVSQATGTGNGLATPFRQGMDLARQVIDKASRPSSLYTPASGGAKSKPKKTGSGGRSGPTAEEIAQAREALELEQELAIARERGDEAEIRALERKRELKDWIAKFDRAGYTATEARVKAEEHLVKLDAAQAEANERELAKLERGIDLQLAQLRNDYEMIRLIEHEEFLERRIAEYREDGLELAEAEARAQKDLLHLEEARADAADRRMRDAETAHQIELARLRGDYAQADQLEEDQRIRDRADDLRREGMSDEEAIEQAMREGMERSRAELQGTFRDTFRNGLRAALNGDLKQFFKQWLEDASFKALAKVLDRLADRLADLVFDQSGGGGGGLLGGLLGGLGGIFGGGGGSSHGGIGQGGGFGGGNSNPLPGFASGGRGVIRGFSGVDSNILSINRTPVARVSDGELLNISRPGNDNQGGVARIELVDTTGLFETRVSEISGGVAVGIVDAAAPAISANGARMATDAMALQQSKSLLR